MEAESTIKGRRSRDFYCLSHLARRLQSRKHGRRNPGYRELSPPTSELKRSFTKRPIAVIVENAPAARPQSGLSKADIVYEILAEGGITVF